MAPRLKIAALLVGSCVAVALAVAMIDMPGPLFFRSGTPQSPDLTRMQREVARIATTIRHLRIADTATTLLHSTNEPTVIAFTGTPLAQTVVRSQLQKSGQRARVVLIAANPEMIRGPVGYTPNVPRTEFMFNGQVGEPWCAAVHYRFQEPVEYSAKISEERLLGPCLFWARHGAPGPSIASWLLKGGYRFADAPADYSVDSTQELRVRRLIFGIRRIWFFDPLGGERCLAGRAGTCAAAVLDTVPLRWRRDRSAFPDAPPTFARESYDGVMVFGVVDPAMLAHLEQRFGAEAFSRFWRSSDTVEPAFQAAFGMSLDEWVREWAQAHYGAEPVGPRVELATMLLSLLTIGVLLGAAVGIVQRREVR
jgi:hypothetical protein